MPEETKPKLKQPPVLFGQSQKLVQDFEARFGSPVVCYWNSYDGSICSNDVNGFYEALRRLGKRDHVYWFIKSDGGNGTSSLRIVNLLRKYMKRITALIPLQCSSAATMLALGANEIQMGPLSYLSAVDTSLRHTLSPVNRHNTPVSVSQDELHRVIRLWNQDSAKSEDNPYKSLYEYVHPLVIGAVDRASSLSIKLCQEIMGYHIKDAEVAATISKRLNSDYPSHNYPITIHEARRIGLTVAELDGEMNDYLLALNKIYSEMGQRTITDFDNENYHTNNIVNIIETAGVQVFYQVNKDWHYRTEERRWISTNDESNWVRNEMVAGRKRRSVLHIS